MTLRTDAALEQALDVLTRSEGVSRQEAVRRAVIDRARTIERREQVLALTEEALEEWAETLERLGRE